MAAKIAVPERSGDGVLMRLNDSPQALKDYAGVVWRLAESWPPVDADVAARQLRAALPGLRGDPLGLAVDLFTQVHRMAGGGLFVTSLEPSLAVEHVLGHAEHRLRVRDLAERIEETFHGVVPCPPESALGELQIDDDGFIVPAGQGPRSIRQRPPVVRLQKTSAEKEAVAALAAAARHRGFRIVLAPPGKYREIGRSVAGVIGARYISFEDRWFEKHDDEIDRMLRAERFAAQRKRLTRSADELLDEIVGNEGEKGKAYVIGDTALLGALDALENVRYLYDLTLSGEHGFWVLVIPGCFAERSQPLFNNKTEVWHLDGVVVQVEEPLPT